MSQKRTGHMEIPRVEAYLLYENIEIDEYCV